MIEHSLYTYCSNHPYRRPDKDPIPIGPVFVATREGSRRIWQPSPDTEEVRLHLLELSTQIPEVPPDEYPAGPLSDEMVVWQLGELREKRSVELLRRVAGFSPAAKNHCGT